MAMEVKRALKIWVILCKSFLTCFEILYICVLTMKKEFTSSIYKLAFILILILHNVITLHSLRLKLVLEWYSIICHITFCLTFIPPAPIWDLQWHTVMRSSTTTIKFCILNHCICICSWTWEYIQPKDYSNIQGFYYTLPWYGMKNQIQAMIYGWPCIWIFKVTQGQVL